MAMKSKKILVVDDSAALRKMLALRLQKFGAEVMMAADGKEGLNLVSDHEFDLVLSDVAMPEMNGLDLCKKLKGDRKTRGIPVILLSAKDTNEDINLGFDAGASAYIGKSASDEQLHKTIDEVLSKAAMQRGSLIMVVDDSMTILRLVESGLAKAGFQVITAMNGKEALELLKTTKPDIIISDLDMPVMGGVEFCDNIRQDAELSKIPFMIMSANSERSTMRSMIERGAAAYMVKPFNMEQFIITVEKLLSEQFQMLLHERERLEWERRQMLASITSLVQALEARDSYTRGHSERVAEISVGIGSQLGMNHDELESLRIGARLHDLGKIGIPDGLLLKEGKLTDMEVKIFRRHPTIGADILEPIPSLTEMIPIVLLHHEHIDGTGYPRGLKGDMIPLTARICAVADCFDALTTDRPYRKGFPQDKAFKIINEIKGSQLCATCVDAFFRWISAQEKAS